MVAPLLTLPGASADRACFAAWFDEIFGQTGLVLKPNLGFPETNLAVTPAEAGV
jgi:hypothetical protein